VSVCRRDFDFLAGYRAGLSDPGLSQQLAEASVGADASKPRSIAAPTIALGLIALSG
jgi:hypothetical protein